MDFYDSKAFLFQAISYICNVSIIKNIGLYFLRSKLNDLHRKKEMCDLDSAQSVGLLFHADTAESYNRVIDFSKSLTEKKGIKVLCIGYISNPKLADAFTEQSGFRFFSTKKCNWYGKPKDHSVDYFIEKDFDILMDLCLEEFLPVQFIVGSSKAKLKVGKLNNKLNSYDVMIDIDKNNSLDFFITQIELYLSMFKMEHKIQS